ncbi:hypothetical protein [Gloeobacter kilaueensis]|uniref:Uncharacterized protein n=1 Tax=Gloeobacter kilaueensis (strain ATCC BAA-2537 / CCAP 1431/1 / ULC 316 / JS1) TaxID=1183438 RepID=U5QE77_GLOK1|nr:hypothetical protein [Gloeobacter kilaueensis]AGY57262.1 hypothetical protein GKIL_1016 [Gloeobacter kilaueensis JS1]
MKSLLSLLAGVFFLAIQVQAQPCRPQRVTRFPVPPLDEASGLVRAGGNFWWTHNDSGDGPFLYAIDDAGKLLGKVSVAGATNVDWEDLAAGRCPDNGGRCLYIGDVGNNSLKRQDLAIYVVREPAPTATSAEVLLKLPVRFTDKPANTEALVYDDEGRQLLLVTKDYSGLGRVFTRSLDPQQANLQPVAVLDLSKREIADNLITGAALSPDGRQFMLRTYLTAFRWQRQSGEDWHKLFERQPVAIPLEREPQGEAIALPTNGPDFYTTSEEQPVLWHYVCQP